MDNQKKIKFYDYLIILTIISTILFFVLSILFGDSQNDLILWLILAPLFIEGVLIIIFCGGMLYYKIKNKKIIWFVADIILLILTVIGIWVSCLIFYFVYLRSKFKNKEGNKQKILK